MRSDPLWNDCRIEGHVVTLWQRGKWMVSYGIIPNLRKTSALSTTRKIAQFLLKRKKSVWVESSVNRSLKLKGVREGSCKEIFKKASIIIALGGDGTILNIVREMGTRMVPIFGVNLGGLGFLTEVKANELERALKDLVAKKYSVEKRMVLQAKVRRGGKVIAAYKGLNDVVITNGALARVIELEVMIDKEYVTSYIADGLIFSTPTGSTAYSLSSGGPIVHPAAKAIIMTPNSPHTLTNRPIVVPDDRVLKAKVLSSESGVILTIDGQVGLTLKDKDIVEVKKSTSSARLVLLDKESYFSILRRKLSWGGVPIHKKKKS